MGKASRPKPGRLAEKLLQIRTSLGLSQSEMVMRMGLNDYLVREEISQFEHGLREPPLPVLLKYARAANIYVDVLIDDNLDLPKQLPCQRKSEGIQHRNEARRKKNLR